LFSYNKTSQKAHPNLTHVYIKPSIIYFAFGWLSTFTMGLFQWEKKFQQNSWTCWHDILKVGQFGIKWKTEKFLKENKEKNSHSQNWKNDDAMLEKGQ
jgi:hypothetical protein